MKSNQASNKLIYLCQSIYLITRSEEIHSIRFDPAVCPLHCIGDEEIYVILILYIIIKNITNGKYILTFVS